MNDSDEDGEALRRLSERMKESNGWSDEDIEKEKQRHAFLDLTDKEYAAILLSRKYNNSSFDFRNPYFVYTS